MELLEKLNTIEWKFYATILAAIITFVLTQGSLFLARRSDRRRQLYSLQVALAAELRSAIQQNGEAKDPKEFEKISEMEISTVNAYIFPSMKQELFEKNCDKLGKLPADAVNAVVEAYGNVDLWNKFANHIKSKEFLSSDKDTQDTMIRLFIKINNDVVRTSKNAIEVLEAKQ